MFKTRIALAAGTASLLLSACGGGDGDGGFTYAEPAESSYHAEPTAAVEPSADPAAGDDKPWYMRADPTQARFNAPKGIEIDREGNMYVADSNNHTVRKIARSGVVTTLAGSPGQPGTADGKGSAARFVALKDLTVDRYGNVYAVDGDSVRKITPDGTVSTLAGAPLVFGYVDAVGTAARFYELHGIAVDGDCNLYVADGFNGRIRKISPEGVVTTLAGGYVGQQWVIDGVGAKASFDVPTGLAIDRHGRLYVTDVATRAGRLALQSSFIRRVDTRTGKVETLAGNYGQDRDPTSPSSVAAHFSAATGIAVDRDGNVYVTDYFNDRGRLQRLSADGRLRVVTTHPEQGRLFHDVTTQWQGNLYLSNSWHRIDRISPDNQLNVYAGAIEAGSADTP